MRNDLGFVTRALLRLIVDPRDRALVRDDLDEEYHSVIAPKLGRLPGKAWLIGMALRSLAAWWSSHTRSWMCGVGLDLVSAFRGTRRTPRLSAAVVASIALGVGATGSVMTLFSSVLLRPLPFPEADRLVRVWNDEIGGNSRAALAWADVRDIEGQMHSVDAFVAISRARLSVVGPDGARRAQGEGVSAGYFQLLGIRPVLGRFFSESDHSLREDPAMVLTFDAWQRQFGGDANVLGTAVRTTASTFTVVGVAPPGFRGTVENDLLDQEFWVPIEQMFAPGAADQRGPGNVWSIARLAEGAALAQAQAEVLAIDQRLASRFPEARAARTLRVEPMGENWRAPLRSRNRLLLASAILLLLVATCNVAGLLITRSVSRKRELAVRSALGSGRARLVRLVTLETLLLTGAGSLIGMMAAPFILRSFLAFSPQGLPAYVSVRPDLTAVAFSAVAIGACAVIAAAVTATLGTRVDVEGVLRSGSRNVSLGRADRRQGEWIIAGEVAVTTVLIVGAGLLGRSLQAMTHADLGYRTERLLRMAVSVNDGDVGGPTALPEFLDRVRATLKEYPGVARVGLTWQALPPGYETSRQVRFEDMPPSFDAEGVPVGFHAVDPELLPTLEIDLLAGRNFSGADGERNRHVAIVGGSLATMLGGAESAIGRSLTIEGETYDIVGVAEDVMQQGPVRRRPRDLDVYVPLAQQTGRTLSIAIQTETDPAEFIAPLQRRLGALAPSSAQHWISTMDDEIADDLGGPFFYVVLLAAFSLSALCLMAVGLFAMVAYQISRQRGEFGVRRAIGATRSRILVVVLTRGLRPVAVGAVVGWMASLPAGRLLGASLYGVGAVDWVTLSGSAAAVLGVGAVVAASCAMAAMSIGPTEALG